MSEEILKPCPFCGRTPEIVVRDVEPQGDPWYGGKEERFVLCECGACLFDGHFHEGFWEDDKANPVNTIKAWNTRTDLCDELVELPDDLANYIELKGARYYYDRAQEHLRARIELVEALKAACADDESQYFEWYDHAIIVLAKHGVKP